MTLPRIGLLDNHIFRPITIVPKWFFETAFLETARLRRETSRMAAFIFNDSYLISQSLVPLLSARAHLGPLRVHAKRPDNQSR
jgi:hypothetical protein